MKCGGLEVICFDTVECSRCFVCFAHIFGNNLNTFLLWKLCEKLDYYNGLVLKNQWPSGNCDFI